MQCPQLRGNASTTHSHHATRLLHALPSDTARVCSSHLHPLALRRQRNGPDVCRLHNACLSQRSRPMCAMICAESASVTKYPWNVRRMLPNAIIPPRSFTNTPIRTAFFAFRCTHYTRSTSLGLSRLALVGKYYTRIAPIRRSTTHCIKRSLQTEAIHCIRSSNPAWRLRPFRNTQSAPRRTSLLYFPSPDLKPRRLTLAASCSYLISPLLIPARSFVSCFQAILTDIGISTTVLSKTPRSAVASCIDRIHLRTG